MRERAIEALDSASDWLIEDLAGPYFESSTVSEDLGKKLIYDFGVQFHMKPPIYSGEVLMRCIIKAAGVHYEILCLERKMFDGQVYEYWVVKVSGHDWSEVEPFCYFIITRSDDLSSQRNIIRKDAQYIESYPLGDDSSISIRTDDLGSLYFLTAWQYPRSYEDSDLKDYKIILGKKGDYKKVQLGWLEKRFLQKRSDF